MNQNCLTRIKTSQADLCDDRRMKSIAEPVEVAAMIRPVMKKKNDLAAERLTREWATMVTMVRIYCRDHHQPANGLCAECEQFLSYANVRLERCHFGVEKPTCAKCPVHCYQRERREQVRVIMRYSGPRMMWEHPVMSLRHWVDGLRKAPQI
jgi:hypothetical protein